MRGTKKILLGANAVAGWRRYAMAYYVCGCLYGMQISDCCKIQASVSGDGLNQIATLSLLGMASAAT